MGLARGGSHLTQANGEERRGGGDDSHVTAGGSEVPQLHCGLSEGRPREDMAQYHK